MTAESKNRWRKCFICHQSFEGGTRHKISQSLFSELSTHIRNTEDRLKLIGLESVRICCRHFISGHPLYMWGDKGKKKWLKKEDKLNVKGRIIYHCAKEKPSSHNTNSEGAHPQNSPIILADDPDVVTTPEKPPKKPKKRLTLRAIFCLNTLLSIQPSLKMEKPYLWLRSLRNFTLRFCHL